MNALLDINIGDPHVWDAIRHRELQSQFWGEPSLELLLRAGLSPGMRVLDMGCGTGDLSMLAATLVGPTGYVLGVDRSFAEISVARQRAVRYGACNIDFAVADFEEMEPVRQFDAIVGRFVLMFLVDASKALRKISSALAPHGIVAFLEMDLNTGAAVPAEPIYDDALERVRQTFDRAYRPTARTPRLWKILREAGFAASTQFVRAQVEVAPACRTARFVAGLVRSLQPMMESFNVATSSEIDIDRMERNMQESGAMLDVAFISPSVFGIYAMKPSSQRGHLACTGRSVGVRHDNNVAHEDDLHARVSDIAATSHGEDRAC